MPQCTVRPGEREAERARERKRERERNTSPWPWLSLVVLCHRFACSNPRNLQPPTVWGRDPIPLSDGSDGSLQWFQSRWRNHAQRVCVFSSFFYRSICTNFLVIVPFNYSENTVSVVVARFKERASVRTPVIFVVCSWDRNTTTQLMWDDLQYLRSTPPEDQTLIHFSWLKPQPRRKNRKSTEGFKWNVVP